VEFEAVVELVDGVELADDVEEDEAEVLDKLCSSACTIVFRKLDWLAYFAQRDRLFRSIVTAV
jgi:hypothetical protein